MSTRLVARAIQRRTTMNTAIVKIGIGLRQFVHVATWIVPLTQWLYFAWVLITFTSGPGGDRYLLPYSFQDYFVIVGFLLTLMCLVIAVAYFIKNRSVKSLAPLLLNVSWIGFIVLVLMMGWGH